VPHSQVTKVAKAAHGEEAKAANGKAKAAEDKPSEAKEQVRPQASPSPSTPFFQRLRERQEWWLKAGATKEALDLIRQGVHPE
jgi:hypothetical protein